MDEDFNMILKLRCMRLPKLPYYTSVATKTTGSRHLTECFLLELFVVVFPCAKGVQVLVNDRKTGNYGINEHKMRGFVQISVFIKIK